MGFIVVLWENENIVSVIKEKKVVGALELKEGTTRLSRSLSLRELLHYEHFLHAWVILITQNTFTYNPSESWIINIYQRNKLKQPKTKM